MLPRKLKVLFLCTGNSCRSQMAEGWARHLRGDVIEAYSAGIAPAGLNPLAARVMAEAGVDISGQRSKHVDELRDIAFDYVITVCAHADEHCPTWLGREARVIHRGFDDPPALARSARSEEEALAHYRRVRDEIADFVRSLPEAMAGCCREAIGAGPERAAGSACCRPAGDVRQAVREEYGRIAASAGGSCCCGQLPPDELARRLGYGPGEMGVLPPGANMGLSCGNPGALAGLLPGEVVLDLGCGGGLDVFLAGPKVGPRGRVIGVDMTPEMISKARHGIEHYRKATGLDNIEFRLGEIEHLPAADASVDVVISNCVINLSPDKPAVWREIARVLRPGGRVAVSDIALLRPLPETVRGMTEALTGCVAGAVPVDEYRRAIEAAGLADIAIAPRDGFMEALAAAAPDLHTRIAALLPAGTTPADYVTSVDVTARKPPAAARA